MPLVRTSAAGPTHPSKASLTRRPCLLLIALLGCGESLLALPRIFPNGIVNGASFVRPGLPGGKIARGSIFSIFGGGLGPEAGAEVSSFPLQPSLAGVSVKVTQGETSVDAIPLFVAKGQINAIMPSDAPLGRVSVRIQMGNVRSNPSPATVVESSFGIFTVLGTGMGPGVIQNVPTNSVTRPFNSLTDVTQPGQIVTLWGTGLGPADFPDNEAPEPKSLPIDTEVFIGGKRVAEEDKLYIGRSPCCAGVDQLVVRLPEDAPLGCYVPVQVQTDQQIVSNSVTLAIAEDSGSCSDPTNPFGNGFRDGGRFGAVFLVHAELEMTVDLPEPREIVADLGFATLREEAASPFFFNPVASLPPDGTCTTYTGSGDLWKGDILALIAPSRRELDAGEELTVSGSRGARTMVRALNDPKLYGGVLGGSTPLDFVPLFRYFTGGSHSVSAPGGADVGPFEVNLSVLPPLSWVGRDEIDVVDRSRDLALQWSGVDSSHRVAILGGGFDGPTYSTAAFFCMTPAGADNFSIPATVLSSVPASRAQTYQSEGALLLWTVPQGPQAEFSAEGLDTGFGVSVSAIAKTVIFE